MCNSGRRVHRQYLCLRPHGAQIVRRPPQQVGQRQQTAASQRGEHRVMLPHRAPPLDRGRRPVVAADHLFGVHAGDDQRLEREEGLPQLCGLERDHARAVEVQRLHRQPTIGDGRVDRRVLLPVADGARPDPGWRAQAHRPQPRAVGRALRLEGAPEAWSFDADVVVVAELAHHRAADRLAGHDVDQRHGRVVDAVPLGEARAQGLPRGLFRTAGRALLRPREDGDTPSHPRRDQHRSAAVVPEAERHAPVVGQLRVEGGAPHLGRQGNPIRERPPARRAEHGRRRQRREDRIVDCVRQGLDGARDPVGLRDWARAPPTARSGITRGEAFGHRAAGGAPQDLRGGGVMDHSTSSSSSQGAGSWSGPASAPAAARTCCRSPAAAARTRSTYSGWQSAGWASR